MDISVKFILTSILFVLFSGLVASSIEDEASGVYVVLAIIFYLSLFSLIFYLSLFSLFASCFYWVWS